MLRKATRASWSKGSSCLQGWASAAGEKMASAARHLDGRQAEPAAADQQAAIDELEKIWDAVIPFHPLLARDLADQTLDRPVAAPAPPPTPPSAKPESRGAGTQKAPQARAGRRRRRPSGPRAEDLAPLTEIQERTLRRTQLLKLKAEAELERLEKSPPGRPARRSDKDRKDAAVRGKAVDPKQIKAGYQKAIELAPRAVEQMEQAVKALKQKDRQAAYPPAEEARKILEEIQKAQPKNDQQDRRSRSKKNEDQKKQDQKDQQKKDQQKTGASRRTSSRRRTSRRKNRSRRSRAGAEQVRRAEEARADNSHSRRSRATGSKRRCARSANGSRKSANETAR